MANNMAKMAEDLTRFSDLCRLCASKASFDGVHIFEKEGEMRQLCKKIENCLPVEINVSDQLPKFICNNCVCKLDFVVDFREKSAKTERILKELCKEVRSNRIHSPNDILVDQNELIMVQSHQLLNEHSLQNMDLTLGPREDILVEDEIILTEHHVDISSHSLESIELSSHALTNQELSNESLTNQETIMVDSGSTQSLQDGPFEDDNLSLIHSHHLLNDQLRLHHGLHVNMSDDASVNISLSDDSIKNEIHSNDNYLPYNNTSKEQEIFEDSMNDLHIDHQYIPSDLKTDDDNSGNSMLNSQDREAYVTGQETKSDFVHIIEAQSKDWYYCNLCEKAYEDKEEFEKHYNCHFYKCELCLQIFTSFESLSEHKLLHTDKSDIKRLKSDTPVPAFDKNESKESNSEESDCDNEPVEEAAREVEDNGINNNRKKKCTPKVCQTCGKSYKTNYKLREHMRKHTGEKPFKCGSCDKAFRSKIGLMQHEAVHTGQYSYSCPTCGKGFQCKSYLMVHQRVHSNIKPYHCTTCGQNFKTKQSLLDHTNRHLGLKPYICDICGRGFITKGLCKAHAKIHTGTDNRKYACKICTKMFVSKSYLQTHLRIHTGEKPFKCEVCEKGFLTRVDLKIHSTIHTGEKSFVCEICGKAFARRDALRCHTRSHTGERPYSCEICGQTFTQFTPMAIHKRLHTGERPYKCETCGRTFVSRSTMMSHAKKH